MFKYGEDHSILKKIAQHQHNEKRRERLMTEYLIHFSYAGLMSFSFLAATILPFSSEAALAAALALKMPTVPVLVCATVGNCAGVAFNY